MPASRSVPFYSQIQTMQSELAVSLLPAGERPVYDLDCSTATTIAAIACHPRCPEQVRFVGIDNSPEMLEKA